VNVNFSSGDFYLRIVQFFSVLLPGVILVFIVVFLSRGSALAEKLHGHLSATERILGVLIAGYITGHVISTFGFVILDQSYVNRYLDLQYNDHSRLVRQATETARAEASPYSDEDKELLLRWATAVVRQRSAPATAEIDQLEATSKMFRSLALIALVVLSYSVWNLWKHPSRRTVLLVVVCFAIFLLLGGRHADRSWKRRQTVLEHYLVTTGTKNNDAVLSPGSSN
jgi:hypothetical protein